MSILITTEELDSISEEIEGNREAVERLCEFASEMAYERDEYKKGMTANFNCAMGFLSDLEEEQGKGESDVEMWRGLCHARAVQLNEAYDEIARLRTLLDIEVAHSNDLQLAIDDMISH